MYLKIQYLSNTGIINWCTILNQKLIRLISLDDFHDSLVIVVGMEDLVQPRISLFLVHELDQRVGINGVAVIFGTEMDAVSFSS